MDEQSSETKEEDVVGEVVGESEVQELVPEWGWWIQTFWIGFVGVSGRQKTPLGSKGKVSS